LLGHDCKPAFSSGVIQIESPPINTLQRLFLALPMQERDFNEEFFTTT